MVLMFYVSLNKALVILKQFTWFHVAEHSHFLQTVCFNSLNQIKLKIKYQHQHGKVRSDNENNQKR